MAFTLESDTSVNECKKRKKYLEDEFKLLITNFEEKFSVSVSRIDYERRCTNVGGDTVVVSRKIELTINI